MNAVNLIPAHRRDAQHRRRRVRIWIGLCAVYGLLLTVGYGACYAKWGGGGDDLDQQLIHTQTQIDSADMTIQRLGTQLTEVRMEMEAVQAVAEQPDWSVLLALLAKVRGEDVVLKRCEVQPTRRAEPTASAADNQTPQEPTADRSFLIRLVGYARSQAAVSKFVLRLEDARLFDHVTVMRTTREPFLEDQAVAFHLQCMLGTKPEELQ